MASPELRARSMGFEAKDGLAFLHHVELVARDRFQIGRIAISTA